MQEASDAPSAVWEPMRLQLRSDDGASATIVTDGSGGAEVLIAGWDVAVRVELERDDARSPWKAWFEDDGRGFSLALTRSLPSPVGSMCVIDSGVIRIFRAALAIEEGPVHRSVDAEVAALARALRRNSAAWAQAVRAVRGEQPHPWAAIEAARASMCRRLEAVVADSVVDEPPLSGVLVSVRHALANSRRPRSIVRRSLQLADDELAAVLSSALDAGSGPQLGSLVEELRRSIRTAAVALGDE